MGILKGYIPLRLCLIMYFTVFFFICCVRLQKAHVRDDGNDYICTMTMHMDCFLFSFFKRARPLSCGWQFLDVI